MTGSAFDDHLDSNPLAGRMTAKFAQNDGPVRQQRGHDPHHPAIACGTDLVDQFKRVKVLTIQGRDHKLETWNRWEMFVKVIKPDRQRFAKSRVTLGDLCRRHSDHKASYRSRHDPPFAPVPNDLPA